MSEMTPPGSDGEFLSHVEKLAGWLEMFTAARTIDLLNFQNSHGLRGPVYEIGVFWGKYFSVLLRGADQGWASRYKDELERRALADTVYPQAKLFQDHINNHTRHNVETQFHRRLTLMFP